jgi:uncharacterized protein YdaU (DUF1376 family)
VSIPYFPMYPTDYEADTAHLSLEEDGAYNRLLRLMWMTPGCSVPDDAAWIARRMRVDMVTYLRLVEPIADEFCKRVGGRIVSPRLQREWEKIAETSRKHSEAAKKRWNMQGTEIPQKDVMPSISQADAKHMQPEPYPEPYPDKKKVEAKASLALADQDECFRHFNETAERVGWAKVQVFSQPRRAALSQRIKSVGGVDQWCEAINRAALSPLLTGQSNSGWRADFDWLAKPANFTKVMEGNYDERNAAGNHNGAGTRPGPHNALMAGFAMAADRLKN